jgi:nucleoside-diphosphate-sugar epimerase
MKVLVIGGTGMISAPVVRRLVARGADVTVFHRGRTPSGSQVKEILGDRCDRTDFVEAIRSRGPWDCIIDMICGLREHAEGLVEAARGQTRQVILCSTTTVYGRPFLRIPVREDDAVCRPPAHGCNKLSCEELLRESADRGEFAATIVRPGHTFNESSMVVHSLGQRTSHLDRMLQHRPIIVHDGGQGVWSAAWAEDVGFAIGNAAGEEKTFDRIYNLTGSEWFTWDGYHQTLAAALEVPPPEILHIPSVLLPRLAPNRADQCLRTLRFPGVYDCSAAKADIGYRPGVSLAEGLGRNVRFLRENGLIEPWENDGEYEQAVISWRKHDWAF